jgi:hypothetical protein
MPTDPVLRVDDVSAPPPLPPQETSTAASTITEKAAANLCMNECITNVLFIFGIYIWNNFNRINLGLISLN